MYGGVPTDPPPPPRGARQLTARPADPQGLGQPRGGGEGSHPPPPPPLGGGLGSPPPYSPQNCRTPLGVTHWLAAAPVARGEETVTRGYVPWVGARIRSRAGDCHARGGGGTKYLLQGCCVPKSVHQTRAAEGGGVLRATHSANAYHRDEARCQLTTVLSGGTPG